MKKYIKKNFKIFFFILFNFSVSPGLVAKERKSPRLITMSLKIKKIKTELLV